MFRAEGRRNKGLCEVVDAKDVAVRAASESKKVVARTLRP